MTFAKPGEAAELVTHLRALRADLAAAPFTVSAVEAAIGPVATRAMRREELAAARAALKHQTDRTAALTNLFLLGQPVSRRVLERALPTATVAAAIDLGLVTAAGAGADDDVVATLDLRPYEAVDAAGDIAWWLISDLGEAVTRAPLRADHVLGVGAASKTLARFTMRQPYARALDLGTGCGIQALHLARHCGAVVATDISNRALEIAQLNAWLNEANGTVGKGASGSQTDASPSKIELRRGSLFDPIMDDEFDLIVSNPPFVITPRDTGLPTYEYRDAQLVGDGVVQKIFTQVGNYLAPGGVAQLLANWEHRGDQSWQERLNSWLDQAAAAGTPLDAWVVQREVQDPAEYAETWLRDGGTTPWRDPTGYEAAYQAWLADFAARNVEAIGFGYVLLRRSTGAPKFTVLEEEMGGVDDGLGSHVSAALAAHDWLNLRDSSDLLAERLLVAPDVTEERYLRPGAADPQIIQLQQGAGYRRTIRAGTALAALVGACDGQLTVGQIIGALAQLLSQDGGQLAAELEPEVRHLLVNGFLQVAP